MFSFENFIKALYENGKGSAMEDLTLKVTQFPFDSTICFGRIGEYFEFYEKGELNALGFPHFRHLKDWSVVNVIREPRDDNDKYNIPAYNWPIKIQIV